MVVTSSIEAGDGNRVEATIHFFDDGLLSARLAIPSEMSQAQAQARVDQIVDTLENPPASTEDTYLDDTQITALGLSLP